MAKKNEDAPFTDKLTVGDWKKLLAGLPDDMPIQPKMFNAPCDTLSVEFENLTLIPGDRHLTLHLNILEDDAHDDEEEDDEELDEFDDEDEHDDEEEDDEELDEFDDEDEEDAEAVADE